MLSFLGGIFFSFLLDDGLVPAEYCGRGGFWKRVTITNPHGRDQDFAVAYMYAAAAAGEILNELCHCYSSKHRGILGPPALARSAGSEMPLPDMCSLRLIFYHQAPFPRSGAFDPFFEF